MIREEPATQPARRSKGQKRTKKKEAVVTATYTIEPYQRTPQEVTEALLRDLTGDEEARPPSTSQPQRPAPVGKEVRAALEGKDIAFDRLAQRVAQREGEHIQQRVALTDGDEALQNRARDRLSKFNVKDRMELSGMRWTQAGAQAVLDLRAVRTNDDWDDDQRVRRQRQHQRLYGSCSAGPPLAETIVSEQRA